MMNRTSRSCASLLECPSSTESDPDRFAPVIATLPGASLIGERWRTTPRTVVIVDGDVELDAFEAARAAFVHQYVPQVANRWVAVAPATVVETLRFRADDNTAVVAGDLEGHGISTASWLPSLAALPDVDVCRLVAYCAVDDHHDFDDVMAAADELAALAAEHHLEWRSVVELVEDTSTVDFDALDATLSVAYGQPAA